MISSINLGVHTILICSGHVKIIEVRKTWQMIKYYVFLIVPDEKSHTVRPRI
jgi:hypothetical protein